MDTIIYIIHSITVIELISSDEAAQIEVRMLNITWHRVTKYNVHIEYNVATCY